MNVTTDTANLTVLSLWIGSRLTSRQAILWVTNALEGKKGFSNAQLIRLIEDLLEKVRQRDDLPEEIKKKWRLLFHAAHDRERELKWHHVEQIRRDIIKGNFSADDAKSLIDFVRPRLSASEPSTFVMAEEGFADDPRKWVIWGFKAACDSIDHGITKIDHRLLSSLSPNILSQILREATNALASAIDVAHKVGWITDEYDFANSRVARIAYDVETSSKNEDSNDQDVRDPDAYHDGFAPLLRLMTSTFDALAGKSLDSAKTIARQWGDYEAALFVRLQAHTGLHSLIWNGDRVGKFLEGLSEIAFWKWGEFPEIATLRALRWSDLPGEAKEILFQRLIDGPAKNSAADDQMSQRNLYWRDHEIARVVDNNSEAPRRLLDIVNKRRASDADFPRHVKAIEDGAPGVFFSRVPDGDAKAFDGVPDESLISALVDWKKKHWIGEGNNTEAYVRSNRRKVVDLLALAKNSDDDLVIVWELALSYPHDKPDDVEAVRETARRIASVSLSMDDALFERIADRLCYWLDATDEQLKSFPGAPNLWVRLLPFAIRRENESATSDVGVDLSSAALNVPFGHLISFFFRRCPTMPAQGEPPSLPQPFVALLKNVRGRASVLLANRMATTINYFWRADADWLKSVVLEPMFSSAPEGIMLWEAFAKYGPVPRPSLWVVMEAPLIKQVARSRLSKDALRRLAEMLIVVWSWTKLSESKYTIDVAAVRSALGISSADVRAAAAWQLIQLIERENDESENHEVGDRLEEAEKEEDSSVWRWPILGRSFFSEVWPMEPAVQSPQSANDFARIPARVGMKHFSSAVKTVLPFLRPFEVWDVDTDFGLTKKTFDIVRAHPTETLALIAASVSGDQKHLIFQLGRVLSLIAAVKPELERDPAFRRLRRFVEPEPLSKDD